MKLKRPHFEKLKSLTKKQKKLILAGIALLMLILAACYTVFIAPLLQKEQWIYKEETVERGTLKVGVTESGSLEYNTKSVDYDLDLDVSDDDEDDSDEDDDDAVQKYLKIEEIYAASGQRVTEGEELLKFTEDSVEAVRALLQNAVVEAQADYAEAESTYELSLLEAQTDYDTQKISASYAASIRNTSGTSVTNNVASLQVQLEQKQANTASLQEKLTQAQEDYQDALETYEAAKEGYEGAGTDNTVNFMTIQNGYLSARTKYQQAKAALTQAETAVTDNESAITDLENQLAAARAKQTIDKLDTEELSRAVFPDSQSMAEEFVREVRSSGMPQAVNMDREYASRAGRVHKIKTDTGIEISIPSDFFNDPDYVEFINNPNGTISISIKNVGSIVNK